VYKTGRSFSPRYSLNSSRLASVSTAFLCVLRPSEARQPRRGLLVHAGLQRAAAERQVHEDFVLGQRPQGKEEAFKSSRLTPHGQTKPRGAAYRRLCSCRVSDEDRCDLLLPDQPLPQGGGPGRAHHRPPPVQDGPAEAVQAHEEHPPLQRMKHSLTVHFQRGFISWLIGKERSLPEENPQIRCVRMHDLNDMLHTSKLNRES